MKRILFAALLGATACATAPAALQHNFDPQEVAWFNGRGDNAIVGSAVMRTVGGDTRTCAGNVVIAYPDSAYARERAMYLYGSIDAGFNPAFMGRPARFENSDPRFDTTERRVHCDAQGFFEFTDLPNGSYFVITSITWTPQYVVEGGWVMRRVEVSGGERERIVLTPP